MFEIEKKPPDTIVCIDNFEQRKQCRNTRPNESDSSLSYGALMYKTCSGI